MAGRGGPGAPFQPWMVLGLAGAGLFVAALDAYVVVTLLPAMIADVGLTIDRFEQATPIVTGFLAGYVVAMPLLGAYSDARGRAPVYAACMAVFAAGSVITATAGLLTFAGAAVAGRRSCAPGPGRRRPRAAVAGAGRGPLPRPRAARSRSARWRGCRRRAACSVRSTARRWRRPRRPPAAGASCSGSTCRWPRSAPAGLLVGHAHGATSDRVTPDGRRSTGSSAALLGLGLGLLVLALYPDDPDASRHRRAASYPAGHRSRWSSSALYGWRQVRRLEPLIPRELLRSRGFVGASRRQPSDRRRADGRARRRADPRPSRVQPRPARFGPAALTHFLIGVPIGAVLGGLLAGAARVRPAAVVGILLSAAAFLQMSTLAVERADRSTLGPFRAGRPRAGRLRSGLRASSSRR